MKFIKKNIFTAVFFSAFAILLGGALISCRAYGDNTSNIVWYKPAGIQATKNLVDSKSTQLKNLKTQTYNGKKCVQASVQNQAIVVKAIMEATSNAGGCGVFY